MTRRIIGIMAIAIFHFNLAPAESLINGTVYDKDTRQALPNVLVRSKPGKQLAITRKSGNFTMPASKNDLLIFTKQGYLPDTLFLVDLTPKKIELIAAVNTLSEVVVTATPDKPGFDPQTEYPEVYEKSKFALSPSQLLGSDARNARRLKRYFDHELRQRKIDSIFNFNLVSSIVPLKGRDLSNFMAMYRPRLSFLDKSSPDDLSNYIKNCYGRFIRLPADEQAPVKL